MGLYVHLGRRRALWIEFRREFLQQKTGVERFEKEWLVRLPCVQMVYTPP